LGKHDKWEKGRGTSNCWGEVWGGARTSQTPLRLGLNFLALTLIENIDLGLGPQGSLLSPQSVVCPVACCKPWNRDLPQKGDLDQGSYKHG